MKNSKKTNLKILEICPYSAGGCGVWARVKQESLELIKKGYKIKIFSTNLEKGTNKVVCSNDSLNGILIKRFPAKILGGESFMSWSFKEEALKYSPEVIIVHNYRHIHTTEALKIAEQLKKQGKKCKIFLVTHAPFVEGNITRSRLATLIVNFYDKFIGPRTLNRFDKVLVISNWEIPYILKMGIKRDKIIYIPNGIPREFFNLKKLTKEENKVLFLGRVSPKKKIETIIQAIPFVKNNNVKFEVVGPSEVEYKAHLDKIIKNLNLSERITFSEPIYDLRDKIAKLDSCKIYVLASRVEGMPQGLIEAMSRGKIVLGSNSVAIRDLIKEGKNGYLFEFDDPKDLARKINQILLKNSSQIGKNAKEFAKQFSWDRIVKKIEALF